MRRLFAFRISSATHKKALQARLHDSVLGTARLNLGTRTYEFWHGTLSCKPLQNRFACPKILAGRDYLQR